MSRRIGSLWKRKKGDLQYYSGIIQALCGNIRIAIFKNDKKTKPNQPDMNIVLSEPTKQTNNKKPQTPQEDII